MEWFVVHTQVNKEIVCEKNLIRQGFITYLPKYKKVIRHARQKKVVTRPLFPRYIFVKMDIHKQRWTLINFTHGVNYLISMEDKPVKISNKIINEIKVLDNLEGFSDISALSDVALGDEVSIVEGIFSGRKAVFDGLTDDNRVKVLFNILGKELTFLMSPLGIVRY